MYKYSMGWYGYTIYERIQEKNDTEVAQDRAFAHSVLVHVPDDDIIFSGPGAHDWRRHAGSCDHCHRPVWKPSETQAGQGGNHETTTLPGRTRADGLRI